MSDTLKIGEWFVKPASGQVSNDQTEHRLEPKVMAVLVFLAENPGRIVTRAELEQAVWAGSVVTYEALTVTINKIRAAFEDNPRNPVYIETLAKRGYRLIAPVSREPGKADTTDRILPAANFRKRNFIVFGLLALLAVISIYLFFLSGKSADELPRNVPSIAVIPFANNNNDPGQDYFAAGITEYLITDLSRLSSLQVIARNSVLGFNSKDIDLESIRELLNTQYVLTGSVLKSQRRIRIAVQLIDVSKGVQVWADRFDRKLDDLFVVQNEITKHIINKLVSSNPAFKRRSYTTNHEAHDYYIRGNALYVSISKEGNSLAREMFFKAIENDPKFASAYSAIALTYIDDYRRKWVNSLLSGVDKAFEYANKAIVIDENSPTAYMVLSYAYLYGSKDPEKSIKAARQAIKLSPNYADAYAIIGSAYSFEGRSVDAIRINQHAIRLNPSSSNIYLANLGRDYYFLDQPKKAIANLEEAIFRNENYLNAHLYLAATYASMNQIDEARWEREKILVHDPEFSLNYWAETQPYTSKARLARMVDDLRKAGLPD